MKLLTRRIKRRIKRALIATLALLMGLPLVLVILLKFINPPFWAWEINRSLFPPEGYPKHTQHQWVPLAAVSPAIPLAIMASEDQRFPFHWGIDIDALVSVIEASGVNGPERGASTITQQTAKNVFLFPSETYIRKAYELYIALLLELIWDKERIMEMYINIVEFGPGIYGVQAASEAYFGVPASRVTRHQAAQLAVVLPNPYKIHPTPMTDYVQERVQWVLVQMGHLDTQDYRRLE